MVNCFCFRSIGNVADEDVRYSAQSVMIAWGEALFRQRMVTRVQNGTFPLSPKDMIRSVLRKISMDRHVALNTRLKNYNKLGTLGWMQW